MLKKINLFIFILLFSLSLTSCIKERVEEPSKPSISIPTTPSDESDNIEGDSSSKTEGEDNSDVNNVVFTVCLKYSNRIIKPKRDEKITVVWDNLNGEMHKAIIEEDGYARIENLDGDYFVHLLKLPDGYTYNPNDNKHFVNQDSPLLEIDLKKLSKPKGDGTGLYRPDVYQMRETGYYRAVASSKNNDPVYFEFFPKESGTYVFESLCDIYFDEVNPIAYLYKGQSTGKFLDKAIDTGGASLKGGYTKNFKMEFSVSNNMLGNVFTFGIICESKNGIYPQNVDFLIVNKADYDDVNPIVGLKQIANELDKAKIPADFDTTGKTLFNTDGGKGNYYTTTKTARSYLDGKYYKYKEDEGIYYYYDPVKLEYITPLCAYITSPNPYTDIGGSLSTIQQIGNKALTVKTPSGDHLDYSYFIEEQYASISNKDGLVFVTKELKDFLQMFSNTQRYFMDGNGYVEAQFNVMSNGADQWLFDCCYFL